MQDSVIYLSDDEKESYLNIINKNWENKNDLKVETAENALVLPFKADSENPIFGLYGAGILDQNGNEIPIAVLKQNELNRSKVYDDFDNSNIRIVDKTAVFLGYYIGHFGHFLVESTSRLWYCLNNINPDYDYIFIPVTGYDFNFKPGNDFLELFGFRDNQIKFIQEPTRYKKIIIPEQAWGLCSQYNEKIIEVFDKVASKVSPIKNSKIYLSRTKLDFNNMFGEEDIEKVFKKNGYKIVYPEQLDLKTQIALVKGADEVAGVSGSAMHLLLFAENCTKATFINKLEVVNPIQIVINHMKKINAFFIKAEIGFLPVLMGSGPFWIGFTKELVKYFADNNLKFKKCLYTKKQLEKYIYSYVIRWILIHKNKNDYSQELCNKLIDLYSNKSTEDLICLVNEVSNIVVQNPKRYRYDQKNLFVKIFKEILRVIKKIFKIFQKARNINL